MLDDLRDKAGESDFFLDDDEAAYGYSEAVVADGPSLFLGMTPAQRFVIAVLVLLMVTVLGSFCLLITEKVYLPYF